ncbi:hypothetical protein BGZ80_005865 [Entomortierella chlamydospora]|uniref:RRM domain-containing protein n=1 Tax=Entomortierella chlamydospora TaxID=101097 RepID=A0A9P6MIY2_9FUNG|nr:hypothetical protein BGZ80_005865 [Entomortierella chlamydospora]
MENLDQSLEQIIKSNKQAQKKLNNVSKKASSKPKSKSKPRVAATALKVIKTGRIAKSTPRIVKPAKPLFTETYKALSAPIKEIFTSRYIPQTSPIKLTTFNTKAIQAKKAATRSVTSKPIRLVTTQKTDGSSSSGSNNISNKTNSPTPPKISTGNSNSKGVYRSADRYRPSSYRSSDIRRNRSRSRSRDVSSRGATESKNYTSSNQNEALAGKGIDSIRKATSKNDGGNYNKNTTNNSNNSHGKGNISSSSDLPSSSQKGKSVSFESVSPDNENSSTDMTMDLDDGALSIKGAAPSAPELSFKGEGGPVTVEIENLDPGTTAEDVKVVCSRFGEIKSCICSNGFSQVTFARRAAGLAAVETLNGKKADNNQILRVSMRKTPIIHHIQNPASIHVPSPIAGPMKLLSKAVEGTIKNAGSLYQEQLQTAQHMLKVQQHRMAQLHMEEQRIAALRMQANAQYGDLTGVWSGESNASGSSFF